MQAALRRAPRTPPPAGAALAKRARRGSDSGADAGADSGVAGIAAQGAPSAAALAAMAGAYGRRLALARFGDAPMRRRDGRYAHHFAAQIAHTSAAQPGTARMERIVAEAESLAEALPLALTSAIFVRVDDERMDVLKVRSVLLAAREEERKKTTEKKKKKKKIKGEKN